MNKKEIIEGEIEQLLIKIKKLRTELEAEEHNLQILYGSLNSLEEND